MSLDAALSVAGSGLAAVNAQFALISHNVANVSTPGYVAETAAQQSVAAGGQGMGVVTAPAQRAVDQALQASLLAQNAASSGAQTTASALGAVDAAQGTPGQGQDLASLLGKLQDGFSSLLSDPSSAAGQQSVIAAAGSLAGGLNALSRVVTQQRQAAQDAIVAGVKQANTALATIGQLSDQIVAARSRGESTADLENQRDQQIAALSKLVPLTVMDQASGDVIVAASGGTVLPIRGAAPLAAGDAPAAPGAYYPGGGIPPVTLNGVDVTAVLKGGEIGANIALRDSTLPTVQAELDEFGQNLAAAFDGQGLPLFTDPAGAVPSPTGIPVQSTYVGFAGTIQVNPAVVATPSAVRDGLPSRNAANVAGFSTLINDVLTNAMGAAPLGATHISGLGPAGTLSAPYAAPATLADFAATLVATQSTASAQASDRLATEQAVQTNLQTRFSSETGVSMDAEMSDMIALQNAYGANAKIIGAVQTMYTTLLGMVSP